MLPIFEELDFAVTPFGEISLRRRTEPRLDNKLIYEVKLGEEFLMSSLFVEAEEQLSQLGIEQLLINGHAQDLNVIVGGLGLGYTALRALAYPQIASLRVIEVMEPVIRWHRDGLLPIGNALMNDPRCELCLADFFTVASDAKPGFFDDQPVHAVLLDIDHSPQHWLNDSNQHFYTRESLTAMARKIVKGGVFGLWSNDLPDPDFMAHLQALFSDVSAEVVRFPNPYSGGESTNSVYIATV